MSRKDTFAKRIAALAAAEELRSRPAAGAAKTAKKAAVRFVLALAVNAALAVLPWALLAAAGVALLWFLFIWLVGGPLTPGGSVPDQKFQEAAYLSAHFARENPSVPYGVPVEKGVIGWGVDDKLGLFGLPTYPGHEGVDISRTPMDWVLWRHPPIFATQDAVVLSYDVGSELPDGSYSYVRTQLTSKGYVTSTVTVPKTQLYPITGPRPFGQSAVLISADGKYATRYAHMSQIAATALSTGRVRRGDPIGFMGDTGHADGVHLHYEIRDCGGDNADLGKNVSSCARVNPLSQAPGFTGNFLGITEKNGRTVYAGDEITRLNPRPEAVALGPDPKTYEAFCSQHSMELASAGVACRLAWSVWYPLRLQDEAPVPYPFEAAELARGFLSAEYGSGALSGKKLREAAVLEGVSPGKDEKDAELLGDVGMLLSRGRYRNPNVAYRRVQSGKIGEGALVADMLAALGKAKGADPETKLVSYFGRGKYPPGRNPFVHNMLDPDRLLLKVLPPDGSAPYIWLPDGAMKAYAEAPVGK